MKPGRRAPLLIGLALLGGCWLPSINDATADAMVREARQLRATYPPSGRGFSAVPIERLPPAIASIDPKEVIVFGWGVEIIVRHDFDGGWGYSLPSKARDMPMPAKCYTKRREGLFAHGPC
jgi:hypothetical protein